MSYEIVLMTRPGRPKDGTIVAAVAGLVAEAPLAGKVDFDLCQTDPLSDPRLALQGLLTEDAGEAERFAAFCRARNLSVEPDDITTARGYLEERLGERLVSLILREPIADAEAAYAVVVAFARQHDLLLYDGALGDTVALEAPGKLPPSWVRAIVGDWPPEGELESVGKAIAETSEPPET